MTTRPLILGTAGHIDHGKTALVRALTGIDTDRLEEEKSRGISIDIGFAHLELPEQQLGIVDVPGHERFIKNMLAGASGIDIAMLVVAADDSVMPQTREHLAILKMLRIPHGLVVLTKSDLMEDSWLDLVEEDIKELVTGTFLDGAPIVRTSATTGAGIDDLKQTIADLCSRISARDHGGKFRLAVDRSFVVQGLGTVVTGSVWSGRTTPGSELALLPAGKTVRVRGLQSHGRDVEEVTQGQRAAINLMGVHHTEIERGDELSEEGFLRPSRRITVRVDVLDDCPWPLKHRARVRLHLGTQEVMASVWLLQGTTIAPGETGYAQLNCVRPVVASGRQPFVLRAESPVLTIGGGMVLQPLGPRISRRDDGALARLEDLSVEDDAIRVAATIRFYGCEPWTATDLSRDGDVGFKRAEELIKQLESDKTITSISLGPRGKAILHRDILADISERIFTTLKKLHEEAPLEPLIPRQRLVSRLDYLPADIINGVIDLLLTGDTIHGSENAIAHTDCKPKLTQAQQRLKKMIIEEYEGAAFSPPDPAALAKSGSVTPQQLRPILDLCVSEGELVHLEGAIYLHRQWAEKLHTLMCEKLSTSEGKTMSEIKTILETSRKYSVPICEYMDRIGLTQRKGDVRVLHPKVVPAAGASHEA